MSFETDQDQDQKGGDQGDQGQQVTDKGNDQKPFLEIEGRTYQTPDDLVKKIKAADEHIAKLEAEAAERKRQEEEVAKKQNTDMMKELLEAVKSNGRKDDQTDHSSNSQLNEDDITNKAVQKVLDTLSAKEKDANMADCLDAAKSHYGDDYLTKIQAKAKELGIDSIDNLAHSSPAAFKKLFVPSATQQSSSFASGNRHVQDVELGNVNDDDEDSKSIAFMNSAKAGKKIIDIGEKYGLYEEADKKTGYRR